MHKLIFTDDAIDAAARLPSPASVEAAACRAIDSVFGHGFKLKSHDDRNVNVSVTFALGGDGFIAALVATDLWEVDTLTLPGRLRTVHMSDRAAALVANMGWTVDAVERSARCAAFCIGGEPGSPGSASQSRSSTSAPRSIATGPSTWT